MEGEACWKFLSFYKNFFNGIAKLKKPKDLKLPRNHHQTSVQEFLSSKVFWRCDFEIWGFLGHAIANFVSLLPRRLLFELCSTNFNIIIIKENLVKTVFSSIMRIPIFNDTIKVRMLRVISENPKELYKNYLKVQAPCFDLCFVEIKYKRFV